ncbi:hypothetical protein E2C01_060481 [Portunus trituberculatus]|uniref:Uncharacterized protein n=1 Tax=Portunus trituberculatus TaxID=210409 RepID=A0A5B7HC77_PORTR|nr:hypothetical protein [Portunus trituberculatus]
MSEKQWGRMVYIRLGTKEMSRSVVRTHLGNGYKFIKRNGRKPT